MQASTVVYIIASVTICISLYKMVKEIISDDT